MIIIRADASSTIGTGHIMRDLVLAQKLKNEYNEDIAFATQSLKGNLNDKITEEGFRVINLNSNDIKEFVSILHEINPSMVVIDHYNISIKEEKIIKKSIDTKLLIVDDLYKPHHCDILLNHNVCADENKYKEILPNNCELQCGKKYTLIRDEFKNISNKNKEPFDKNKIKIFIAMGGADHSHINLKILKALELYNNIHISIVTTTANENLKELENYCHNKNNVALYINTNKMATLMIESDFVIISPSVIPNETLYLNLPLIAIKTADNQNEMHQYLLKKELYIFGTIRYNTIAKSYAGYDMQTIIIATIKEWNIKNYFSLKEKYKEQFCFELITSPEELTLEYIQKLNPKYIFFPHWSWIISKEIYTNYECIVFHMTDLPFGRGGSPLQNLIINKIYDTKITALKVDDGLDSGDIYFKTDFNIGFGSATEIFEKASDITFNKLIPYFFSETIIPKKQEGTVTTFKRRNPKQSNLNTIQSVTIKTLYDFIRMLDAQGYPKAFFTLDNLNIEFSDVQIKDNTLSGKFEVKENEK